MSFILYLFIAAALGLIALLLYALRPSRVQFSSADAVFETLCAPRDYYRLPQIMLALRADDTEFLAQRGDPDLCRRIRAERKAIALNYMKCIESDYNTLIEASRVLAAMAPEVVASQEWDRVRLTLRFNWNCRLLRWRLQTGLKPWNSFARISDMASQLSFGLEQATTRIGERAVLASEFPSLLEEGGGKSR